MRLLYCVIILDGDCLTSIKVLKSVDSNVVNGGGGVQTLQKSRTLMKKRQEGPLLY